jgi:CSLREA domain-containing protein
MRLARVVVTLLTALLLAGVAPPANAATFIVNSKDDTTDGACAIDPAGCTLREAIEAVVATPGRDTIRFDASVFPQGQNYQGIVLTSALPVIADPAGTVVDGAGTSLFLTGGNNDVPYGLAFASAPGVPLAKVTVANLTVASFTGAAIHVCGGELPGCDEDVTDTVVQRIVTNATTEGDGIRIEGRNVTKTRIADSVGFQAGRAGIRLDAGGSLIGWRIQGCTVRRSDQQAIVVLATGDVTGGAILDTTAVDTGGGITIESTGRVSKTKIANVVVNEVRGIGISVDGDAGTVGVTMSDTVSTGNLEGIIVRSAIGSTAPTLTNVVVDGNFAEGMALLGRTSAAKISRLVALGNGSPGLAFSDNAVGASVSNVIAAANGSHGLNIRASASKLKGVRADANGGNGLFLTPTLDASGNTVEKNVTAANDGHGIVLATGSTGNRVQKNVALGNGDNDFRDVNPSCDANVWSANTFRTSAEACIQ